MAPFLHLPMLPYRYGFILLLAFVAGYTIECMTRRYTPSNDEDIFDLMVHETRPLQQTATTIHKTVLACTMLSDDFRNYGAGASKLGHALKRDARALRHEHGIKMTTALLEMQVPFSMMFSFTASYKLYCTLHVQKHLVALSTRGL